MKYSARHLDEAEYIEVAENYYARLSEWSSMTWDARNLDFCRCVSKRRKGLLFTGQSACAALGIPRTDPFTIWPHCISEIRKPVDVIRWNHGMWDHNAAVVGGLLFASPARVICDLAKADSPESLLVSINHCLYKKMFTKARLLREIEKQPGNMRGKKLLRRLLRFATPNCESPLETLAWIAIYKAGFVMPQQQFGIRGDYGFFARTDMLWKLPGGKELILELDGLLKYEKEGSLKAEKVREHELRKMGYDVIRTTWNDVVHGELEPLLMEYKVPRRRDFIGTFPKRRTLRQSNHLSGENDGY